MKQTIGFLNRVLLICLLCTMAFPGKSATVAAAAAEAPVYGLTLSTPQMSVGGDVVASVYGTNVSDVFGYEVVVAYDTDRLAFKGAGSLFPGAAAGFTVSPILSGNQVTIAFTKIGQGSGESGNLSLNSLTFTAKQAGTAAITLLSVKVINSKSEAALWQGQSAASVTISDSSGGGGGGGSPASSNGSPVADATKLDMTTDAKVTQEKTEGGQPVTKVAVDGDKLRKALAAVVGQSASGIVTLEVQSGDPVVRVELPVSAVADAAGQQANAIIQIKQENVTYHLPVSVLKGLSQNGVVSVIIAKVSGEASQAVLSETQKAGSQSLTSPIDFSVELNGRSVTDFNGAYVDRTLSVSSTVDPNQVTAVWVDENNTLRFIPSVIANNGSRAVITIHSPHNSIYTVVQTKPPVFADLQHHWAQGDVELLAHKLIVSGVSENAFAPDRPITRAEFAALLVRALGLEEMPQTVFTDVQASDWFAGAVGTARKAGLVSGYEDQSFRPNDPITREQMVTMIVRALKAGGQEAQGSGASLSGFSDRAEIADWAQDAAAKSISAGIVQGTSGTTFSAKQQATRAESAVMLKRTLQVLKFIN
ncbi:S-layer homology domain-containing protein [Paenibacillus cremeus]|uniref:SLH domain-containing protein n=1 Tax=Paenibacillus cremeus TaxID=2163881 RepID=A0A559K091_9BACL|nr:S-layer homology domain-containing protein [Paenibacillus cremeus]TVY05564.1 hypothetical protein FPZ49_29715 [Paenibacillus cremeus]